jgi:3-oxoacyl-[acyl-carrier-protein] synthase-1
MPGITAATVVSAAGHGVQALWDAVLQGRSALRCNDLDWCELPCWIGVVPGVEDPALARQLGAWDCRNHRLAWLALQDAGFAAALARCVARHGAHRIGLVLGTSTSGIRSTEEAYSQWRRSTPPQWPASFDWRRTHAIEALPRFCAEQLGLQGPMVAISTACSSSAKVFLTAQRWLDAGLVDAAVVGGVDSLCLSTLQGFDALQLLSNEPCRPFDAARSGISIGEAGGFALLERDGGAWRLLGGGESSDAWHMSTPHPQGQGAQDAMREALDRAQLQPSDIGYVNAHGTATPVNDRTEAVALCAVFGSHKVPVSSTKGVTGHALGAAGIVEAIVALGALERQVLPPTANLQCVDDALAVDIVTVPRAAPLRLAMSSNFGFGGSNCTLIFGRAD